MTRTGRTYIKRRGMTHVPNATVFDESLSLPALGVLTFLLGRPDKAPQGYRSLLGRGLGQKAILALFGELHDTGYRHQAMFRMGGGFVVTQTVVTEDSMTCAEAVDYLRERVFRDDDRAAYVSARSELQKQGECPVRTVRDSPMHGRPMHGPAPHISTRSKGSVTHFVRTEPGESKATDDPQPECEHGEPLGSVAGVPRCPLCRDRLRVAGGLA